MATQLCCAPRADTAGQGGSMGGGGMGRLQRGLQVGCTSTAVLNHHLDHRRHQSAPEGTKWTQPWSKQNRICRQHRSTGHWSCNQPSANQKGTGLTGGHHQSGAGRLGEGAKQIGAHASNVAHVVAHVVCGMDGTGCGTHQTHIWSNTWRMGSSHGSGSHTPAWAAGRPAHPPAQLPATAAAATHSRRAASWLRTGNDGGVAGVVLRNVLLNFAHQVSTHIGGLQRVKGGWRDAEPGHQAGKAAQGRGWRAHSSESCQCH